MTETERARRRRERLLDEAAALIERYGYDKTTVDDLARAAGISKGAFYLVFDGKEALFVALIEREAERLLGHLIARMDAEPGGMTLFTLYDHSIRAMLERPLLRAIYLNDRRMLGDWQERIRGRIGGDVGLQIGADFVVAMQAAGLIRPELNPHTVTAVMLIIRQGLLYLPDMVPGVLGERPAETSIAQVGQAVAAMMQSAFGTAFGEGEAGKAALRAMFAQAMTVWRETGPAAQGGAAAPEHKDQTTGGVS
jgi:AcrR family transcriptional regulator